MTRAASSPPRKPLVCLASAGRQRRSGPERDGRRAPLPAAATRYRIPAAHCGAGSMERGMARLLIVGATGLVGQQVVAQALADPRVSHVVALPRRAMPSRERLENVVIDFADLHRTAAWWSVDGVVCALGPTRAKTRSPAAYREIDYG